MNIGSTNSFFNHLSLQKKHTYSGNNQVKSSQLTSNQVTHSEQNTVGKRDPFITDKTPDYVKRAFEKLSEGEQQSLRKISIVTMGNERIKQRLNGDKDYDYYKLDDNGVSYEKIIDNQIKYIEFNIDKAPGNKQHYFDLQAHKKFSAYLSYYRNYRK